MHTSDSVTGVYTCIPDDSVTGIYLHTRYIYTCIPDDSVTGVYTCIPVTV